MYTYKKKLATKNSINIFLKLHVTWVVLQNIIIPRAEIFI